MSDTAAAAGPPRSTRPPFAYYGAKNRLARWIVSLLPPHRVYLEPFAGFAAVLLAKPASPHEILNDLDGDVVCFFRVLRDRVDELAHACRLTPYARDEFDACASVTVADDLERARRFWVRVTQGFGKTVAGTGWSASALRGTNKARETLAVIDRFHAVAARLRTTMLDHRPSIDAINLYGVADAVIYADPPYLETTRLGADRRGQDYAVEYRTEAEHRELADTLHATPAVVLLSGYPSPLYDELYAGWWRAERTVVVYGNHTRGGTNRSAIENHLVEPPARDSTRTPRRGPPLNPARRPTAPLAGRPASDPSRTSPVTSA